MSADHEDTSVFTDDSGTRQRAVTWVIRGLSGALGLGVAAAAVSIVGHVTLPGLDAPLHLPGVGQAKKVASPETSGSQNDVPAETTGSGPQPTSPSSLTPGQNAVSARQSVPTSSATTPNTPATKAPVQVTTPAPTTPTVTAKPKKPHGKPTAKPPTAANPEPTPGGRPSVPPGKAKQTSTEQ